MSSDRPRRSDAVRNRAALLVAADAAFAEHGADASLSATAARAGVAVGTLYKHFPTRRALVGALLAERHDALFAAADTLTGTDLGTWVRWLAEHAASYGGLAEHLAQRPPDVAADPDVARLDHDCARMDAVTRRLVDEARTDGTVRDDVTADDVTALAGAAAWTRRHHGTARADRLLAATLAGWGIDHAGGGTGGHVRC